MKKNKDIYEKSVEFHASLKGKMTTELKKPIENYEDLSLMYTPGVAAVSEAIHQDEEKAYDYTFKNNTVAIVSDGSAVLGLGNIGPKAALPVMEGKAALFKQFAGVNAVPVVLDTQDPEEIISIVKAIAPGFGGINLEDIQAPGCVLIEEELDQSLEIPVFHDDQHGTSIVTIAGLINALKLVDKKPEDIKMVISGAGAAGSAIVSLASELGVKEMYAFNSKGIIHKDQTTDDPVFNRVQALTNEKNSKSTLEETMKDADVFIGVSVGNIITESMVQSMAKDPIILAMANPYPEIDYDKAKSAGARVVGTGRSDYPNQINNVLVFPSLFKALLKSRAKSVPNEVKLASAKAIASLIGDDLNEENIIPSVFNEDLTGVIVDRVVEMVERLRENGRDI